MRRLLLVLAAATLAACSDSTGPKSDSITGSYTLRTANGQPLPFSVSADGITAAIESGSLALADNHTFQLTLAVGLDDGQGSTVHISETASGTYAVSGDQVTFTSSDFDAPMSATLGQQGDARSITWLDDTPGGSGATFVFVR